MTRLFVWLTRCWVRDSFYSRMTYFCHWSARAIFLSLWTSSSSTNQKQSGGNREKSIRIGIREIKTLVIWISKIIKLKMISHQIKRSLIRYCSISKRYLSSETSDVFKLQERGFFCENLAEVE